MRYSRQKSSDRETYDSSRMRLSTDPVSGSEECRMSISIMSPGKTPSSFSNQSIRPNITPLPIRHQVSSSAFSTPSRSSVGPLQQSTMQASSLLSPNRFPLSMPLSADGLSLRQRLTKAKNMQARQLFRLQNTRQTNLHPNIVLHRGPPRDGTPQVSNERKLVSERHAVNNLSRPTSNQTGATTVSSAIRSLGDLSSLYRLDELESPGQVDTFTDSETQVDYENLDSKAVAGSAVFTQSQLDNVHSGDKAKAAPNSLHSEFNEDLPLLPEVSQSTDTFTKPIPPQMLYHHAPTSDIPAKKLTPLQGHPTSLARLASTDRNGGTPECTWIASMPVQLPNERRKGPWTKGEKLANAEKLKRWKAKRTMAEGKNWKGTGLCSSSGELLDNKTYATSREASTQCNAIFSVFETAFQGRCAPVQCELSRIIAASKQFDEERTQRVDTTNLEFSEEDDSAEIRGLASRNGNFAADSTLPSAVRPQSRLLLNLEMKSGPILTDASVSIPCGQSKVSDVNILEIHDENYISTFILKIVNFGTPLLLHKQQRKEKCSKALSIVAFLRKGQQECDWSFSGPSLEWVAEDDVPLKTVNVFAIKKIERASSLHLENYPFAMPQRSIILTLKDGSIHVFEAQSESGADCFVFGIRWVIARLSFNLIIGNQEVSCELIDIGMKEGKKSLDAWLLDETKWTRAMNGVSNNMVDNL